MHLSPWQLAGTAIIQGGASEGEKVWLWKRFSDSPFKEQHLLTAINKKPSDNIDLPPIKEDYSGIYEHFKCKYYRVICSSFSDFDDSHYILYRSDTPLYCRTSENFFETIIRGNYFVPRFRKI